MDIFNEYVKVWFNFKIRSVFSHDEVLLLHSTVPESIVWLEHADSPLTHNFCYLIKCTL